MDIKNILEKLSEIEAKQTLLESAPAPEVLAESTVVESTTNKSIYDILVSELLSEADYTLPKGKLPNATGQEPAAASGAGIANPPPNLNVAPPAGATSPAATAPAAASGAAPAADAKPGFADRVKAGFSKIGDWHAQNTADYNKRQADDAAARSPEGMEAAKAKLTPSQLKWLGGAKPEPEILARMPAPLPGETAGGATPAAAPTTAPATTAAATAQPASDWKGQTDEFGGMEEKPIATTSPVATPAVQSNPTAAAPAPAAAPAADKAPEAPAVTANPTATLAKTAYKGSAGAQEIQKLNPAITDVNKIQAGQTLKMPDGSTYTVKPGDTLDRIAKGVKPADDRAKVPPAKPAPDQYGKAPPAAPAPATRGTSPATPDVPFKKELDLSQLQKLSGQSTAPAPGALGSGTFQPKESSVKSLDDAILERIRSALKF